MKENENYDIISEIRNALRLDAPKKKKKEEICRMRRTLLNPSSQSQNKRKMFWKVEMPQIVNSLLKKRLHIGQHRNHVLPEYHPYLHGFVNSFSIINLNYTIMQLRAALKVIYEVAEAGGEFLIASSRKTHEQMVQDLGDELKISTITSEKWVGGSLTNHEELMTHYEKKTVLRKDIRAPLEDLYRGTIELKNLDLIILLNPIENRFLLNDARILGVPVIALVDTHTPMKGITYPIVCNNQNTTAVFYLLRLFAWTIKSSKLRAQKWTELSLKKSYSPAQVFKNYKKKNKMNKFKGKKGKNWNHKNRSFKS